MTKKHHRFLQAELEAILHCLQAIAISPEPGTTMDYLLFSDSLSALQSIADPYTSHRIILLILLQLHSLSATPKNMTIIWIPIHIPGNERVDQTANEAILLPRVRSYLLPTASDRAQYIGNLVKQQWHSHWSEQQSQNNKLAIIKPLPYYSPSSSRASRKQEIILIRILISLRIGHIRLTHTHLVTNLFPLSCPHCNFYDITVDHLFPYRTLSHLCDIHSVPHNRALALQNNNNLVTFTLNYFISNQTPEHSLTRVA